MPQSKHDAVKPLRMRLIPGLLFLALVGCSSEKEQTDPDEQEQPQQEQGTWTPLSSGGPLAARSQVASVFDGQNVLLWGGRGDCTADGFCGDGARFNVAAKTWTPMSTQGALSARSLHTAVWTGERMIIWGGIGCGDDPQQDPPLYCDKGAAFDPVYRVWSAISTKGAPSPRIGHTAVWTGSKMVIWGGTSPTCGSGGGVCSDGAAYDPATDTWAPLRTEGAPSARTGHVSVWTGNALFIWGGMGASGSDAPLSDGALWVP